MRTILISNLVLLFLFSFSALSAQTMHDEELKLIELINEMRTNPRQFLKEQVEPYMKENDIDPKNNKYAASLISDLRKQPKTVPITPDKYLTDQARLFAKDMGETGGVGHHSKKLGGLSNRLRKYGSTYIGENCSYGYSGARDILIDLLIDEGIPSLGHRKNLLNRKFTKIGVAIEPHRGYEWNCVMDFGG